MEFRCHRCLLVVELSTRALPLAVRRPEGWAAVDLPGPRLLRQPRDLAWRCKTCVQEVESGSPEEL